MSMLPLARFSAKLTSWATPHIQRWTRNSRLNEEHAEQHFKAGDYGEAEKYYTAAIQEAERRHSSKKRLVELMLQLAETRRRKGDLDGAFAVVNDAIGKTARAGPLYGPCLDALSGIQSDRGEPNQALEASRAALEIARRQRGAPAAIAERCSRLAALEQRCGNSPRQMELLQESIAIYEKVYGPQHVETANRLTVMGVALRNEGSFAEALVFLERACGTHKQLLGGDAPEYVSDVEHLAATQQGLGNLEESAKLYDRLLRLKENQLGVDPIPYGHLLVRAAEAYTAAGLNSRAYEAVQHGVRTLERYREELTQAGERIAVILQAVGRRGDSDRFRKRLESLAAKPA